ncbi:MAG: RidA family protein [Anaerolineae bacterium]|nr:RidA family protein [Anaerolineae bacterium]
MAKELINPKDVHEPTWPYAHAVKTGNTIYISAQLPLDPEGKLVGPGDPAAQAEQVFRNLQNVLKAAGASMEDVVKLTTYLLDFEYRPAVMEARNRFFGNHRAPSILAVVNDLPVEGALVEVDGIAVVDN